MAKARSATEPSAVARPGWCASLALTFTRIEAATRLTARSHNGPLQLQKILYPEGAAHAHGIILHPPGGIAGGDTLHIDVTAGAGTGVLLTTPGATKWYRANDRQARQRVALSAAAGAVVEYFPQENILFNEAIASSDVSVDLAPDAVFAGWEITCFGRPAGDIPWVQGAWRQSLMIASSGRPLFHERLNLCAESGLVHAMVGMAGRVVQGTLVVAAGAMPADLLGRAQQIAAASDGYCGVSALPRAFTARYLGDCTQEARRFFEAIRAELRPWYAGRPSVRPRIWAT